MAATIMAIVATQSLYVMRSSYARCIYIFRNAFNSGAGNIFNQRCLVVLFLVDSQEDVIAINILYKSTVLPVRLRHAADHLAEHEHPIHLVFLDRVPGCIALVV
ncbi:Uncharacterised protein [Klebsiella pneumoniae]|nr:Uncharacterised protein [Klebsiella pneumoniae]